MATDPRTITNLFETASLGAPQNAVGFVMWRVVHRYQREVDQALRPLGLTHLQFVVLALSAWTARSGETATQSELSVLGDIHPMQVSNVVRALDRNKLVERTPSRRNTLAKRVEITAKGLEVLRAALPLGIEIQARLFGNDGRPGGRLLETLVRIDREGRNDFEEHGSAAIQPSRELK